MVSSFLSEIPVLFKFRLGVMRATCPANLILLGSITLIIVGKENQL
jgi:hypothetical protein